MKINKNIRTGCPEPGMIVEIFACLYLVTENVKDQFIEVVRLSDGFLDRVRTDEKFHIVEGEFVVKS